MGLIDAEAAEAPTCFIKGQNILKHTQTLLNWFSAFTVNSERSYLWDQRFMLRWKQKHEGHTTAESAAMVKGRQVWFWLSISLTYSIQKNSTDAVFRKLI